jgi:hypothetical protein
MAAGCLSHGNKPDQGRPPRPHRDFLENNDKGARLFDYLLSYLKRLAKDGYASEANQIKLLMIRVRTTDPRHHCFRRAL